jgi:hypothetical protein
MISNHPRSRSLLTQPIISIRFATVVGTDAGGNDPIDGGIGRSGREE